jgi:hypothetical protein
MEPKSENQDLGPIAHEEPSNEVLVSLETRLEKLKKRLTKYETQSRNQLRFLTIIFSAVSAIIVAVAITQTIIAINSLSALNEAISSFNSTQSTLMDRIYTSLSSQGIAMEQKFENFRLTTKNENKESMDQMNQKINQSVGESLKKTSLQIRYNSGILDGSTIKRNLKEGQSFNLREINFYNNGDRIIRKFKFTLAFSEIVDQIEKNEQLQGTDEYPRIFIFPNRSSQLTYDILQGKSWNEFFTSDNFLMHNDQKKVRCEITVHYEDSLIETATFILAHQD